MITINLKNYYENIEVDTYIEVQDDVFELLEECITSEESRKRKDRRNNIIVTDDIDAYFKQIISSMSLDIKDIIEPNFQNEKLYEAIEKLPDIQARRIKAHYFMGLSKQDIAQIEGCNESSIRLSLKAALRNLNSNIANYIE